MKPPLTIGGTEMFSTTPTFVASKVVDDVEGGAFLRMTKTDFGVVLNSDAILEEDRPSHDVPVPDYVLVVLSSLVG